MRVWDIDPSLLCRNHLLGEHREIHAIYAIIVYSKKGYSNHPETNRWRNHLWALYLRHEKVAEEMKRRGWNHHSNLGLIKDNQHQNKLINTIEEQVEILKNKKCKCKIE